MKLVLDTTKSLEENAALYFEKSKKAKRKVEGIEKTIELTKKKMFFEEEKKQEQKKYVEAPQKKWYMKFRWFISSDGFLCIGGRDATTNEILVKKHTEKTDLVFHTDLAGSPFFVIKAEGKEIPKMAKEETAQATASFSRAWTQGLTTAEVYAIAPDQGKKELGLPKGAFMIHGKREYFKPIINIYIECYPLKKEYPLKQEGKKTDTAKFLQQRFIEKTNIKYSVDEIMQALPGDCSVDMQ